MQVQHIYNTVLNPNCKPIVKIVISKREKKESHAERKVAYVARNYDTVLKKDRYTCIDRYTPSRNYTLNKFCVEMVEQHQLMCGTGGPFFF